MTHRLMHCVILASIAILPAACSDKEEAEPENTAPAKVTAQQAACEPSRNPGIDCACVGEVLSTRLNGADYATVFTVNADDMDQGAIDTLIDVAMISEDVCAGGQ